jgi:hypothetical protein
MWRGEGKGVRVWMRVWMQVSGYLFSKEESAGQMEKSEREESGPNLLTETNKHGYNKYANTKPVAHDKHISSLTNTQHNKSAKKQHHHTYPLYTCFMST